jgi:lysophospholipase L1-like esterase
MALKNPNGPIVVIGASYAKGWNPDALAGIPIVNAGEAGQQSFEMLARFERDVVGAQPRAVIIWGFINDIFRAEPGRLEETLATIRASYTRMIELARQQGIEPMLATEVTVRPQDSSWGGMLHSWIAAIRGKESYQDGINRSVMRVNEWLKDSAREQGLLVLDLQQVLSEAGSTRRKSEFTQPDGSHLTAAAYQALTVYANSVLENHFVERRPGM